MKKRLRQDQLSRGDGLRRVGMPSLMKKRLRQDDGRGSGELGLQLRGNAFADEEAIETY